MNAKLIVGKDLLICQQINSMHLRYCQYYAPQDMLYITALADGRVFREGVNYEKFKDSWQHNYAFYFII